MNGTVLLLIKLQCSLLIQSLFGGDAAWGPENIIWAVAHGHQAAISIDNFCSEVDLFDSLHLLQI